MIMNEKPTLQALKNLSTQDFLAFGMHDIAYVRPIVVDGKRGFAVHAADGTPLSVMDTMQDAMRVIHQNDLESAVLN